MLFQQWFKNGIKNYCIVVSYETYDHDSVLVDEYEWISCQNSSSSSGQFIELLFLPRFNGK